LRPRCRLPRRSLFATVAAAFALVAGSAPADARTPLYTTIAADVAETLAGAKGAQLLVADGTSGCMTGSTAQPVAVRSDRILLRTASADDAEIRALVAHESLVSSGWTVSPTVVARLTLAGAGDEVPVVVVNLGVAAAHAAQVVKLVRGLRLVGLAASPDYGLSPSGGPLGMWPFGPPAPTSEPLPTPRRARIGTGVTIALYDTGVPIERFGALAPTNLVAESDIDKPDVDADGIADLPFTGHTLAVASVVATLAPSAEVFAFRIASDGGVPTDLSAAVRVIESFAEQFPRDSEPQIVLMPFGTPACDDLPPLALQMVTSSIVASGRSLIVASAGNRSSDRPFYPAAFDGVLAVGSLDLTTDRDGSAWTSPTRAGPRSEFSNYGSWVDAWAGGEQLVTHHLAALTFYEGGPSLQGVAEVAGTSFAAPMVAALLAEGVALTGRPADWVWRHLLRPTGMPCPASGGGVAVALTSMRAPFFVPPLHARRSPC
jgi:hypothetical protein